MVDYAQAFKRTLLFTVHPKWWGSFFVTDFLFFAAVVGYFLSQPEAFAGVLTFLSGALGSGPQAIGAIVQNLSVMAVLFFVWILVKFLISGACIFQAGGAGWREGLAKAVRRYPRLVAVMAIYGILASGSGMLFAGEDLVIALVQAAINIIIVLLFGLSVQALLLGKRGILGSFKDSFSIFSEKPVGTILMQAAAFAFSAVVGFVTIFAGIALALPAFLSSAVPEAGSLLFILAGQLPLLALAGGVMALGLALGQTFGLKLLSEFYLAVRKG